MVVDEMEHYFDSVLDEISCLEWKVRDKQICLIHKEDIEASSYIFNIAYIKFKRRVAFLFTILKYFE